MNAQTKTETRPQSEINIDMANAMLTSPIAILWFSHEADKAGLMSIIEQRLADNFHTDLAEAYGDLFDTFGKRRKVEGKFTESTPADSFNSMLYQTAKKVLGYAMKPTFDKEAGTWSLIKVIPRAKVKGQGMSEFAKLALKFDKNPSRDMAIELHAIALSMVAAAK